MKKIPLINKHLFYHTKDSQLSRGFLNRRVGHGKTEKMYFGCVCCDYTFSVYSALIHCVWDDFWIIEGIQINFADDKYNFTLD